MKKLIIGMFLSTLGTVGILVTSSNAAEHLMDSWNPDLGRYLSTLIDLGLVLWLVVYAVIFAIGLIIVFLEYRRKQESNH